MAAPIGPFFLGPTEILALINLLRKNYQVPHDPDNNDWRKLTVDVLIPTYNEQRRIGQCLRGLEQQSVQPNRVFIIDDASSDQTTQIAADFSQTFDYPIEIIKRDKQEGKTPSLSYVAHHSTADVLFVLDGDTILQSTDYIARVLDAIASSDRVASACGTVKSINKKNIRALFPEDGKLANFLSKHQHKEVSKHGEGYISRYRNVLYTLLQRFVYRSQIRSMGTLINPLGCAVGYRRERLKAIFDRYAYDLGCDLTYAEDVFFGFSFNSEGYRNFQLEDITCVTQDPSLPKVVKQTYIWSSSFFQSCYLFIPLVLTPLKCWRFLFKRKRKKIDRDLNQNQSLAENNTADNYFGTGSLETTYPLPDQPALSTAHHELPLGQDYTRRYGRPIGWYIFLTLLQKMTFPAVITYLVFVRLWLVLGITLTLETLIVGTIVFITSDKKEKLSHALSTVLVFPIRYLSIFFDIFVFIKFLLDIVMGKKLRRWRK